MDEDVRALRKAARASPDDLAASLELAVALERSGKAGESFDVLLVFARRKSLRDEARAEARKELASLIGREPAAVLERLRRFEAVFEHGRGDESAIEDVSACLRDVVELGGLPIVVAIAVLGGPGLPEAAITAVTPAAQAFFGELPRPERLFHGVNAEGHADHVAIDGGPMVDLSLAFNLLLIAREQQAIALLPWVNVLRRVTRESVASEAVTIFRELTGHDYPLVDVGELMRRFRARPS